MTSQTLEVLLNSVYTSTAESEKLLRRLTQLAGFSSDNITARLAIARSLTVPLDGGEDPDSTNPGEGKQIKGFTLLGRREIAAPLIAMIIQFEGSTMSESQLRQRVKFHWERGLKFIDADLAANHDFDALLTDYAQAALPSELAPGAHAAVSPEKTLGSAVVGQVGAKKLVTRIIEVAVNHDGSLPQPIVLQGTAGQGKTTIAKAIAEALQIPFIGLGKNDLDSEELIVKEVSARLASQGYLVKAVGETLEIPPVIVEVSCAHQLTEERRKIVLTLHPGSRPFNGTGLRTLGGGIIFSSPVPLDWPYPEIELDPYTRNEIAEILRRQIGGWPLEMRRYLALAGRLNPNLAISKAEEFSNIARSSASARPSEGLLLEVMEREWGMDRLGLKAEDYLFLERVYQGAELSDDIEGTFIERLGLAQIGADGNFYVTRRGRQALDARRVSST